MVTAETQPQLLRVRNITNLDYGASRNDYNYEALVKNNLPGSQKDTGSGYGKKDYGN